MNYQDSQKSVLLGKFSNIHEVTTPVITTTQFKQQYGNGYRVFTRDSVKRAIDDLGNTLQKGLGNNDMIKSLTDEINSCQKVYVTNGKVTDILLVKAFTADEISKAMKADIEAEEEKEGKDLE